MGTHKLLKQPGKILPEPGVVPVIDCDEKRSGNTSSS